MKIVAVTVTLLGCTACATPVVAECSFDPSVLSEIQSNVREFLRAELGQAYTYYRGERAVTGIVHSDGMKINSLAPPKAGCAVAILNLWLIFGIGLGFQLAATRGTAITSAISLVASISGILALAPGHGRPSRVFACVFNVLVHLVGVLSIGTVIGEVDRGVGIRLTSALAVFATIPAAGVPYLSAQAK